MTQQGYVRTKLGGSKRTGEFVLKYESDLFIALAEGEDGRLRKAHVDTSLHVLLEKCKEDGLELIGVRDSATERIHRWLVMERPVDEYLARLFGVPNPSERGPIKREFGFRTSLNREEVDN